MFLQPSEIWNKKAFDSLRNSLDLHSSKFEKNLILGDFNVETEEANMKSFCENYNWKSLIKQPTSYENANKPTCIDLVPQTFQSACVLETGLSDFHLMTVTALRKSFKKMRPRVINYRSCKDFSNKTFRVFLIKNLSNKAYKNFTKRPGILWTHLLL